MALIDEPTDPMRFPLLVKVMGVLEGPALMVRPTEVPPDWLVATAEKSTVSFFTLFPAAS
jgi:hypothetical protein